MKYICASCGKSGKCYFEKNNLVCKKIAEKHFQLKAAINKANGK